MQHRTCNYFPEYQKGHDYEIRDYIIENAVKRSFKIFVGAEKDKNLLVKFFNAEEGKIIVQPYSFTLPKLYEQNPDFDYKKTFDNLNLPTKKRLFIYPAQFWAHKNHVYLLEGLLILEQRYGIKIAAIFSGSDKGNKGYIKKYARKLNLQDRVRFVGFVKNDEMVEFYRQSIALVMPTYFGPTNLPPLEAFQLGVPVLYPDKPGLRNQVGEAALLMDLKDPNSMALHLKNLIEKKQFREQLIISGYARLKHLDSYDRVEILKNIIQDFYWRRSCWN